jgi:methionyl-tRNA formyltransferase
MRLIFMGTPEFAAVTLQALLDAKHEIACVYSQPPRPAGRGYELKKSPVHVLAETQGIEVRTPVSLKTAEEQQRYASLNADAAVVVAYGLLLPKPVLTAPRYGCFNIHASLLPRWRGAAPIQRAIMAGDAETGVTIMRMEEGLDTGPMVKSVRVPITVETTAARLHDELASVGGAAMRDVLQTPDVPGVIQPLEGVTYAKKIDKSEAHIDFGQTSTSVRNHIHGLSPFPGAWFSVSGSRIKVLKASVCVGSGKAGTFLADPLTVACGSGAIQLLELQREGKASLKASEFIRGFPIAPGSQAN